MAFKFFAIVAVSSFLISVVHSLHGKLKLSIISGSITFLTLFLLFLQSSYYPLYMASYYRGEKQVQEAIGQYQRSIFVNPRNFEAYALLANFHNENGDSSAAIDIYVDALALYPNNIELQVGLGNLYVGESMLNLARAEFRKVLELNDLNLKAHYGLVNVYVKLGDSEKALYHFQRVGLRKPSEELAAQIDFRIGLDQHRMRNYDRAIVYYERAVSADPAYVDPKFYLANIYLDRLLVDQSIALYLQVIELKANHAMALNNLGTAYRLQEQWALAEVAYKKALSFDPKVSIAHHNLGLILEELGEVDQAITEYKRAKELDPGSFESYNSLSRIYTQQHKYESAIAELENAVQPDNPEYYWQRGLLYHKKGNFEEAIEYYEEAIILDYENLLNGKAHDRLAWLYATSKEPSFRNGELAVESALKANAFLQTPERLDTLAAAYAENGNYVEAVTTINNAIALVRENNQDSTEYEHRKSNYDSGISYTDTDI